LARVFYLCPDSNRATGGNKKIYNHVDFLRERGVEAYVLHSKANFRCTWFKNTTPIAYPLLSLRKKVQIFLKDNYYRFKAFLLRRSYSPSEFNVDPKASLNVGMPIQPEDFVVIPEFIAKILISEFQFSRIVIFNQGVYITFAFEKIPEKPFAADKNPLIYNNPKIERIFVVSQDSQDYLSYVFPSLSIKQIHNSINKDVFYPREKKQQIAFMSHRLPEQTSQLITILRQSSVLAGWTFFPIVGLSENKVAEVLGESAIFLSFASQEGCPLPPAEAMSSGCVVVGYHGQGAKNYLKEPYALPIAEGDIVTFAKTVEEVANNYEHFRSMGQKACQFIRSEFSLEREKKEIWDAWSGLLG